MTMMIEKVARAICAQQEIDPDELTRERPEYEPYPQWWGFTPSARAAIEAMREDDLKMELAKRRFDNSFTVDDDGCFVWQGAVDRRDGYGRFYDGSGKTQTAYGFAWKYYCGEVPSGMVLDHICRNRRCVNHTHLRVVTSSENVLIGVGVTAVNAAKTHCAHGHPLSGGNLYVRPNGERDCRECRLQASRRHRARKQAMISAALSKEKPE